MFRIVLLIALSAFSAAPLAVEEAPPANLQPLPEPPDIPPPVESGETLEPDVTIIRKGKETIEEYRIHNRLYMVKIKPAIGPAYYMVDTDGDGTLDHRRGTVEEGLNIPQWVLFSW